jgi:competence protein ComEC
LPLNLAILRALVVEVSGKTWAVPLNSVQEIVAVEAKALRTVERREVLQLAPWGRIAVTDASRVRVKVVRGCIASPHGDRCEVESNTLGRAILRLPPDRCAASPGDVIEVVATVRAVVPMRNPPRVAPDALDALRGRGYRLDAASCERVERASTIADRLRAWALRTRAWMERSLLGAMPPEGAARARALLFGDTDLVARDEIDAFRESGLAHLLAVSGAHIALLVVLTRWITRAVLVRVRALALRGVPERASRWLPLPVVGFFVLVTGESASAVRALLSACVVAAVSLARRKAQGEPTVALVALVMTVIDPTLALDVGFALSVIAAWTLARKPARDEEPPPRDERVPLWRYLLDEAREGLATSARVGLAVMPLLAWHFGRTPVTAVVMNVVAAPVGEALMLPAVLTVSALGALPSVAPVRWVGACAGALLKALFTLPGVAMRLPFASVHLPMPTPGEWVVATAGVMLAFKHAWPVRAKLLVACAACLALMELSHRRDAHPTGALRVTAIDVGQGDAIVVELPDGAAMLVDAGGAITGGPDPGEREVVPWLALRRRTRLAAVVLSHPHPDHAGGLPAVLNAIHADALWDTGQGRALEYRGAYADTLEAARRARVPVLGPRELCGSPRWFHGAWLEVLAPCPGVDDATTPNDASFVIRLTYGKASVLLPGDLEREGERRLIARLKAVTALKVGHHGSRTSSTDAFLERLRPRVALVSCGHPSPFGHPHDAVLERFQRRGINLRRTDLSGAVTVTLRADGSAE